ncbi:MAG: prolipoprotein diacylglyceryl transferase [Clostridia bacterium]|nr:prolipoprotein diacylglyceryl transferase [Clostridia bacterium]
MFLSNMLLTHTIGFEGLGIEPFTVNRVAISNIFNLNIDIYWYAVIITFGMILALLFAMWRAKDVGLTSDNIIDVALWGVPAALIGARLYYVLFSLDQFETFADVINFRNGGLAIYGGIIAGFLAGFIFCKIKKLNPFALFDLASFSFLIGQTIGRWGNFINGEAHGDITNLPWGMTINELGPFHPTFIYESLWNLLGILVLFIYLKKIKKEHGEIFFMYIAWYGIGRAYIEGLRTESLMLYEYRISQILSLIFVIIAIACLVLIKIGIWKKWEENLTIRKLKREGTYNPVYKPLLENQPKNYIAGEDSDSTVHKTEQLSENNDADKVPVSEDETKAYFEAKAEELRKENIDKEKNKKEEKDVNKKNISKDNKKKK